MYIDLPFCRSGNESVGVLNTGEDNYDITFHVTENETCESSNVFYTRFSPDEAAKLHQGFVLGCLSCSVNLLILLVPLSFLANENSLIYKFHSPFPILCIQDRKKWV